MKKTIVTISLALMMVTGYSVELSDVDEAKFNAAVKAYRMNQSAKALSLFTELHNDYPQNQQIKNNYAVVLFGSGKLEQAEEVLSSVIESSKEVNIAYKNLNKIYDYAAAKAYSNALGTEKEVTPQKLQIIETLVSPAAAIAATDPKDKNLHSALENVIDQKDIVNQVADSAPNTDSTKTSTTAAQAPAVKEAANNVTNNVQVWANTWSKADVNSYVATALKDAEEPLANGGVVSAVLNQPPAKPEAALPVTLSEPVAKTKPTEDVAETKAKPETVNEVAVVEDAIRNWAGAWSRGDVDSYITYYEPTFKLGKLSHKQWIKNRKQRISPAENIQVKIADLVVTPSETDGTIIAYFKQSYQANQYKDNTSKQLVWKKIGEKWFIKKEIKLD
jgi:hypothetical protein